MSLTIVDPEAIEGEVVEPRPRLDSTYSDSGNGSRFAELHEERYRYVVDVDRWLRWKGTHYHEATQSDLRHAGKAVAERLLAEAAITISLDEQKAKAMWALKSANTSRIEAMIKMATSEERLTVRSEELDRHHHLLNVQNGTVDLRNGHVGPHLRSNYMTKLSPIAYDEAAACPRWHRFLTEVFAGDEELIKFLKRAVGYSLTGLTTEHVFFILHGSGCNGKSRFARVLAALLGDAAKVASFSTLVSDRGKQQGNTPELAMLFGARVVSAGEPDDGVRLSEGMIKALTGEDEITVCRKYEHPFTFNPTFKLWLHCNHQPEIRGTDDGIWRRPKLVPFNVSFKGREDRELDQKLNAELPGILRWAIEGSIEWFANGLGSCPTVDAATTAYREESDALGPFLNDCVVPTAGAFTPAKEMYEAYEVWCKTNGADPWEAGTLSKALKKRGYRLGKGYKNGEQSRGFKEIRMVLP